MTLQLMRYEVNLLPVCTGLSLHDEMGAKGRMLIGIPEILSPELLKVLDEMGHSDEIILADANFPGCSMGKPVIRMAGHGIAQLLQAILQVFPLDDYVEQPLILMAVPPGMEIQTPIWDEYRRIVSGFRYDGSHCFEKMERFTFYERVRKHSTAVVMTGETALNANIILKKGVVRPQCGQNQSKGVPGK